MASVEEVSRPECENQSNLPKKQKMDSLLLAVENRNLDKLKELVEEGADVKVTGSFTLNEHHIFENVPPLYAAMLSGQGLMVNYLVEKFPHFPLNPEDPERLILPTDINEHHIEVLELVAAACIFYGNLDARKHVWV